MIHNNVQRAAIIRRQFPTLSDREINVAVYWAEKKRSEAPGAWKEALVIESTVSTLLPRKSHVIARAATYLASYEQEVTSAA